MAPYELFERGEEKWVDVKFESQVTLPDSTGEFWLGLDFRAHQSKGVYVSYDTSSNGKHSLVGLPGMKAVPTKQEADWMVRLMVE